MGIIKILNHYFLLMIEEAQQVCVLENHNIYQIASVNFVALEVYFYRFSQNYVFFRMKPKLRKNKNGRT